MTTTRERPAVEVRASTRNGAVGLAGAAVSAVGGFVLTWVIARGFGAVGAGAFFAVMAVITVTGAVCCLGADTGLIWALPRRSVGRDGDAARLLPVALLPPFLLAVVVAIAGAGAAATIAPGLLDRAGGAGPALVRLAFIAVPLVVAMTILLAAVRAVRPIGAYVSVQFLLVPLTRPVLVGAAVLTGGGVLAGLTGWALPVLFGALVAGALIIRPLGIRAGAQIRPTWADWRAFWGFALPRAGSAAIDASSMWVGVLLTAALAGQAEAGVFGAVGRYVLAGQLAMQGLRVAVAPQLSRLLGADRRDEAAAVHRRTTVWIVALSWPGYVLLATFAPAFLRLFGPGFANGAAAMSVLAIAMLVNVGAGNVQTLLLMSGNSRRHLLATLLGLTFNVGAGIVLIPRYGALGAAVAWSIGIVLENVVAAMAARAALRRPLGLRSAGYAAAACGGSTAVVCVVVAWFGGRDVPGLLSAIGLLALAAAAPLTSKRVRTAIGGLSTVVRGRTHKEAPA
jgi:O-antigen/teichoic acid export membrane protein